MGWKEFRPGQYCRLEVEQFSWHLSQSRPFIILRIRLFSSSSKLKKNNKSKKLLIQKSIRATSRNWEYFFGIYVVWMESIPSPKLHMIFGHIWHLVVHYVLFLIFSSNSNWLKSERSTNFLQANRSTNQSRLFMHAIINCYNRNWKLMNRKRPTNYIYLYLCYMESDIIWSTCITLRMSQGKALITLALLHNKFGVLLRNILRMWKIIMKRYWVL